MKKQWKDIEGRKVRIDVGSSREEAFGQRFPAEAIAFTTDNVIVFNGETFGSLLFRVSGVVIGGTCESMSTIDEGGSVVYMSDLGVFAYYASDGSFYNNWTDPAWPRNEYPAHGQPLSKGSLIASSGKLSLIDKPSVSIGKPARALEAGLYRALETGDAQLLLTSGGKDKYLEARLAKAEETINELKALLLMTAKV